MEKIRKFSQVIDENKIFEGMTEYLDNISYSKSDSVSAAYYIYDLVKNEKIDRDDFSALLSSYANEFGGE